jgi:type 1 fimbria pilin
MKFIGFQTVAALALLSTSVMAANSVAVVGDVSGKVMVNKGKGFVPVVGSFSLNVGDRVMVGDNSFATVSFSECAVSYSKPTVFVIADLAPCAAGKSNVDESSVIVTPTADASTYVAPFPIGLVLLGTAGAATAVYIGVKVLDDNNDNNVPPTVSPP